MQKIEIHSIEFKVGTGESKQLYQNKYNKMWDACPFYKTNPVFIDVHEDHP